MSDKVQLRSLDGRSIDFSFSNGRRVFITSEGSKPALDPEVAAEVVRRLRGRVEVVTAPVVIAAKVEVKAEAPKAPVVETVPVPEEVIESDAASQEEGSAPVSEASPKKSQKGSSK